MNYSKEWLYEIERRYSSKGKSLNEIERISKSILEQNKDKKNKYFVQGGPVKVYKPK